VEFLEYELPAAGRPMLQDTSPTDLWHWHITVVVRNVGAAATVLCARASCVSNGMVAMPDGALGFTQGFLVRDPDGHALQLVSR
jgi:predicted enzyme related to lactoylglutathione lyase